MSWLAYAHGLNGCAEPRRREIMEVKEACPQCQTEGVVVIDGQEIPCGNCDNGYTTYEIKDPSPPKEIT
jgi:hypothetical protein